MSIFRGYKFLKYGQQQVINISVVLVCILMVGLIDITHLPRLLAVLTYEIMLLAAVAAIINMVYLAKRNYRAKHPQVLDNAPKA